MSKKRKRKNRRRFRDNTYKETWEVRIENLNGMTYGDYLSSDHWKYIKKKAARRKNYQKCEFCNETKVELHHKNYKWINTPFELRSIIALCRNHHQEVHDFAKKRNISVRMATNKFVREHNPEWNIEENINQILIWDE